MAVSSCSLSFAFFQGYFLTHKIISKNLTFSASSFHIMFSISNICYKYYVFEAALDLLFNTYVLEYTFIY